MRATPGMSPTACASSWAIARGAFRSESRQLKGDRHGEIAEGAAGRYFDRKIRYFFQAVLPADRRRDGVVDVSLNGENHRCVESVGWR
jgi:hypothetical protein